MTVLTVDQIIEFSDRITKQNPFDVLSGDPDVMGAIVSNLKEITKTLEGDADSAVQIVLRSMSEEKFVDLCSAIEAAILISMVSSGEGLDLLKASMKGELRGYTHTVALSVVGILHREGVL